MGQLTENEIFSCLADNFSRAASLCEDLARKPKKGPSYKQLRDCLRLLEGACRQAGHWREDSRWFKVGLDMATCHKRAGEWLRGVKQPDGSRRAIRPGELHPLFVALANTMRKLRRDTEDLRLKATNRVGMILPETPAGPHRDTRPVGWTKTNSGLYVPGAAA